MNHLNVHLCEDADDAVEKCHIYSPADGFKAVEIDKVVVVLKGERLKETPLLIWY